MLSPSHWLQGSQLAGSGDVEDLGLSGKVEVMDPHRGPGTLWGYPPVEVPSFSDELVAALVMIAASGLGTTAAHRSMAFSLTAGRLVQIAARI